MRAVEIVLAVSLKGYVTGPDPDPAQPLHRVAPGVWDDAGRLRYVGQVGYVFGAAVTERLAALLGGPVIDATLFADRIVGTLQSVDPVVTPGRARTPRSQPPARCVSRC